MNPYRKEAKNKSGAVVQQGEEQENQLMSSISTSLHNFKIKMSLGRGAGSYVFLIEEYKSNQLYALKTITKQSQYYTNNVHRITNEYNLHSQLDHQNIVKILRRFEDVEYVYMMIEYCPGGSLFDYVKSKGRLHEEETREISYQIVLGLEYLHKNKIIHRDLKPGNILLTGNNNVKICDFGLAVRLLDYDSERDTFCGTPNYIAPEICSREPYGMKSDCWSFGCILYTIATGRPPFETLSIQQTLKMLQKKNQVVYPSHLSKTLQDLIEHILDWNSDSRYTIQQIKNHAFFSKCRQQAYNDKEYKLQNPMTFAPIPAQLLQSKTQPSTNSFINANQTTQQPQQPARQRSHYSMDNVSTKNVNLQKVNECKQVKQNTLNNLNKENNENKENNINKENIHSKILNQINYNEKSHKQIAIPLQKSSSLNSQQQQQQNNNSFHKENSEQNIEMNRKKQIINDLQNTSHNSYGYNPQIPSQKQQQYQQDNISQQQQKPQSKTILNTFLTKTSKSNSLHQSSSVTPYSSSSNTNNNNNNNSQVPLQNNFFQSQKSYKNPIAQILNENPQQIKSQNITSHHQKNKSFDISSLLPPSSSTIKSIDSTKNTNAAYEDIPNRLTKQQSQEQQLRQIPVGSKSPSGGNINILQQSTNIMSFKENINSKMTNSKNQINFNYPSFNNLKQDILNQNLSSKNQNSQNMRFPPPPPNPYTSSGQQQNIHGLNSSNYNSLKQSTSQNKNANLSQNSFDLSQLRLDYSQMNNFSVERELQSTAQFSSKSNSILTPSNTSMRNRPPSVKNPQTQRNSTIPSFAPTQSILRAKGTSNEYIRTEPACENDINETPRLECLETENNGDTSTAACSKYSMSTTNRSFSKGLNTSKSFNSFIVDASNEHDKSSTTIQQPSNNLLVPQISPVKVGEDLDISKIKTKNGFIEITQDRSLLVESCNGRLLFKISQDGKKINKLIDKPMEKHYTLESLPQKYYALYGYAKQVVNALKTKKVITKLENKEGIFTLLEDDCFEAQFKTGHKIYYKKKNACMRIKSPDNKIYEVSLEKNSKDFPEEIKTITNKSIKYYEYLMNQMKEFQNI